MKFFLIVFFKFFILYSITNANEMIFNQKKIGQFFMNPETNSPMIYPLELGHKMKIIELKNGWYNVTDEKTGLNGGVKEEDFGVTKPLDSAANSDYEKSFEIFSERLEEMSKSIEDAIGLKTFIETQHMGGVAAVVVASEDWFLGRRHKNQAFQVYEIWRGLNQTPSFLSFRDESGNEKFIVLSGPHRPRYLKSN